MLQIDADEFADLLEAMLPKRGLYPSVDDVRDRAESFAARTINRPGDPDLTRSAIKLTIQAAFDYGCLLI